MRIGIITAMEEETLPIYKKLGNIVNSNVISGVLVREIETKNNTIYLATSGCGEIRAAAATQMLIDLFDVELILNFGFVGALDSNLRVGELVIAGQVCHYQYNISGLQDAKPGQYYKDEDRYFYLDDQLIQAILTEINRPLNVVKVASGDKFVSSNEDKNYLKQEFGAQIAEMELAGIVITAIRNNIPVLSIKIISDNADNDAKISFEEVVKEGITKYEEILPHIITVLNSSKYTLPPKIRTKNYIKNI